MTFKHVLSELKDAGTTQTRKIYSRHGVSENMFGVSFADYKKLAKQINTNHEQALELWNTGNHDARILATMIADPQTIDNKTLDLWSKDLDNYVITDAFSSFMKKCPLAYTNMEKWVLSDKEWVAAAGHSILSHIAMSENDLEDKYFEGHLKRIESKIHSSKNRARYSMNNCVIAIGIRNDFMKKKATAAAKRIGQVDVDHGQTSCKTPDAISYIDKTWERKSKN